jgi:hypothetical protein
MLQALLSVLLFAQAPAPAPTPPTVAEAHTGKSGLTVWATPAAGQATAPIVTQPVLTRGNLQLPLIPGPVSAGFWSWSLPAGEKIAPGDQLALALPAGWVAGAPALSVPLRNSVGQVEFPIPQPTMALGLNLSRCPVNRTALYCPVRNWAVRLGAWDANCTATDPTSGLPTTIKGTTTATICGGQVPAVPVPAGLWTVQWDSTDPNTKVSLGTAGTAQWIAAERTDLKQPGTSGAGITRVFQLDASIGGNAPAPFVTCTIAHPQGKPKLANLRIWPPGNTPDPDPLAVEQAILDTLTVAPGQGPTILRFIDACAAGGGWSNICDPADLPSITRTSWATPGRVLTAQIAQVRPLDPSVSPNILGTVWGDLPIAGKSIFNYGSSLVCEIVTAAPHGFKTGQLAQFAMRDTLAVTVNGQAVSASLASRVGRPVYVTGPTTFAVRIQNSYLPNNVVSDPDAAFTPSATATATVRVPDAVFLPYEFAAAMSSKWPGTICWIPIPANASDACVDAIATKVLSKLAPGCKVIAELSNETFNTGFPQNELFVVLTRALATQAGAPQAYVKRTSEVVARFKAIFGDRSGDVLSVINWQPGTLDPILARCQQAGFVPDIVSYAAYYTIGAGPPGQAARWGRITATWSAPMMHDLARHYVQLDPVYARGMNDRAMASIRKYEAAIGHPVLHYCYEASIEHPIPGGNPGTFPSLAARTWDWEHHPDAADTQRVFYAAMQSAGVQTAVEESAWIEPRTDGYTWGVWHWQGQQSGPGIFNVGHGQPGWTANQSVKGMAWRLWQAAYWSKPAA